MSDEMDGANRSLAIGAFSSRAQAEHAVLALLAAGFGVDRLAIVLPGDADSALEPTGPTAIVAGEKFRDLIPERIPEEEVRYYEEAPQEDRPLVMVQTNDRFAEAAEILSRHGGIYMAAFYEGVRTGVLTRS